MQTNVKLSPNFLTSPTQPLPNSHTTLTQLSLFEFQKKFVPLPTLEKVGFIAFLISFIYCFTNIQSLIMGKVTSLYGKTTGKIGSIVFSTSGGETIAREYNPHVANPNTMAQVNQRARMKLMSQLSAALSPVIAMTKDGLVSRRNKFVKANFDNSYALEGAAQISYENVQLTEGSVGLPQIITTIGETGGVLHPVIALSSAPAQNISRVVYCIFEKTQEARLSLVYSTIVSNPRAEGAYFGFEPQGISWRTSDDQIVYNKEYVIYAYGMADTSEKATARYGNMNVLSASDIATLVANRSISFEDYQFTQTRGTTIGQGSGGDTPTPAGQARVFVTALGQGGTVSGGGTYPIGQQVTVTATPNSGFYFKGWANNGSAQIISTEASYTFTLQGQTDLVAMFDIDTL